MTANSFQLRSILTENDDGNFNLGFVDAKKPAKLYVLRGLALSAFSHLAALKLPLSCMFLPRGAKISATAASLDSLV